MAIASKKISKTVSETCAKCLQFGAVSETRVLAFFLLIKLQSCKLQQDFWMCDYGTCDEFQLISNVCQTRPLFVYFRPFLNTMTNIVQNLTIIGKSVDGVLWIKTAGCRMAGTDESTEFWHTILERDIFFTSTTLTYR